MPNARRGDPVEQTGRVPVAGHQGLDHSVLSAVAHGPRPGLRSEEQQRGLWEGFTELTVESRRLGEHAWAWELALCRDAVMAVHI